MIFDEPGRAKRWRLAVCAGLAIVPLAVYAPAIRLPFVFDDHLSIVENPTILRLWPLGGALLPPHGQGLTVEGRPVLNFSLAVNHSISGFRPWSYHAINVLIHAAGGLALFGLVRRTLRLRGGIRSAGSDRSSATGKGEERVGLDSDALAAVIAMLWSLHPLQTESVTYVIQRAESLAGLFLLLTLYCFSRGAVGGEDEIRPAGGGSSIWLALSFAACLLGMATKEIMYAAPLAVLLYDRAFVCGGFAAAWRLRPYFYLAMGGTWIVLAILVVLAGNRGGTAGIGIGVTPWLYAASQCQAIVHYLWLCFWPHPLVFDYGVHWPEGVGEVLPYAFVVIGLVGAWAYCLFRRPALGFVGFCFFAILAPTSSVLPGNRQTLAEHRMYLPLAAVIVVVVVGGYGMFRRAAAGRHLAAGGLAAVVGVAVAFAALTIRRNEDYVSELVLYRDTVAKRPGNAFAHYNLGKLLDEGGAPVAAMQQYREAIRLDPGRSAPYNNLGKTLADLGRVDEAIPQYEAALRINPGYARAHYNLGVALLRRGRRDEARQHFDEAVRLEPGHLDAHENLGGVLLELGRAPEAIVQLEAALRIDPSAFASHLMLGNALLLQGRPAEAIPHYQHALRLRPGLEDAQRNLDWARRQAESP